MWYEHVTGESFEGVSLTEQWQRVDVLARVWRAYGDGRAGKQPDPEPQPAASGPRCVECGRKDCDGCGPPPSDEEVEYTYDDY